jgi:predicted transcriptional regulator
MLYNVTVSITLSFKTDLAHKEVLDKVAKAQDRNRNWVINQAIQAYLELHEWQLREIDAGVAESDAGKGYTTAQLRTRLRKSGIKVKA